MDSLLGNIVRVKVVHYLSTCIECRMQPCMETHENNTTDSLQ